jgi:hypothetical protein
MRNSVSYSMVDMLKLCEGFQNTIQTIFLEYEAGLYITLDTSDKMEMGVEMVVNYHEAVRPSHNESTWLEPTGSRWMSQLWEEHEYGGSEDDSQSDADISDADTN